MTRRTLRALAFAIAAALPFLLAGDALAEEPPAANLHSAALDLGNGYGQTVWLDDQERPYDLGLVFGLPAPRAVPGIAIPAVYDTAAGDVPGILRHAAGAYGVSEGCLKTIAWRESRNRPWVDNAQGSGARGLMQFKDGTWAFMAPRAGYGGASVYDAWAAAHVAAWAIANPGLSQGGLRHWGGSC